MKKITQVTSSDVGRIAVSIDREESNYRVRYMGPGRSDELATVDHLNEDGSLSYQSSVFKLESGAFNMYWEDEMKQTKNTKPRTPFETWCAEEGYDPKGWFVYDMDLCHLDELCLPHSGKFKILDDDTTSCPRFVDEDGFAHYEYFHSPLCGVVMKQEQTEKAKIAKPRFHKKRQKPPVRQKTDVVIQYKTGQSYTIKNAKSVSIDKHQVVITTLLKIESGIYSERSYTIESNLVNIVEVKAPKNEDFEVHNFDENDFSVFFDSGFAVVSQWFKSF